MDLGIVLPSFQFAFVTNTERDPTGRSALKTALQGIYLLCAHTVCLQSNKGLWIHVGGCFKKIALKYHLLKPGADWLLVQQKTGQGCHRR